MSAASHLVTAGAHRPPVGRQIAAEWLGTSVRHIDRLRERGLLPYLKIGGKVMFDPQELDALIERSRTGSEAIDATAKTIAELVAEERAAQGLSPKVTDPQLLARVTAILRGQPVAS